jgi:hypothetical protein
MSLELRVEVSVIALTICWIVYGAAFGIYLRDPQGSVAFYIWSVPFFVAGWLFIGIPVITMGDRILRIPKVLLGVAGAIAGEVVMVLPFFVLAVIAHGTIDFSGWRWSFKDSTITFFTFAPAIGASGVILYAWLLSRAANKTRS